MALFSERMGYVQPGKLMQIEETSEELRTSIYNIIYITLGEYDAGTIPEVICRDLWTAKWHQPIHDFPAYYAIFYEHLHDKIMHSEWYVPYDLIEFVFNELKDAGAFDPDPYSFGYPPGYNIQQIDLEQMLADKINDVLKRECSGYRLIEGLIVPITNENELEAVSHALEDADNISGASTHIKNATTLLSKRPDPDYLNSVKESITAAESAARSCAPTKTSTLADAVNALEKSSALHKSLAEAWKRMFGYTCDANGIRHGGTGEPVNLDFAFAKYMLVTCSAFVNYLVEEFGNDGQRES